MNVTAISPNLERPINSVKLRAEFIAACRRLDVKPAEMTGARGDQDTANRRHVLMYWLRVHKGGKLGDIALLFKRTHPIVLRSAAKVTAELQGENQAYWRGLLGLIAEGEL